MRAFSTLASHGYPALDIVLDHDQCLLGTASHVPAACCRFRTPPTPGEMKQALATQKPDMVEGTAARPFPTMQVIGHIKQDGLGLLAWWEEAGEEQEEGEGDEGDHDEAGDDAAEMEEDG